MKRLAVLGSTGSIGRQTLEVVAANPGAFSVHGLAARGDVELLRQQVAEFGASCVVQGDPAVSMAGFAVPVLYGEEGLVALAAAPEVDQVVVATSGAAGFAPTLAAIHAGKEVALANKEVLVMAGELVIAEARARGVTLRPIDSEHSALWQCLQGEDAEKVERLILTASGGPFRTWTAAQMAGVTPEEALHHPTWRMGPKITVDSATLFNKGLEVIEAHWLFGLPYERIAVVVHPQSVIHSMVEFRDGSIKAQLGAPDMRLPIQYALGYPERLPRRYTSVDWAAAGPLTFAPPDEERFPCLRLAREAGVAGSTFPTVLAAADEVAVELFLARQIAFPDIPRLIEGALTAHRPAGSMGLEAIRAADGWAREWVRRHAG